MRALMIILLQVTWILEVFFLDEGKEGWHSYFSDAAFNDSSEISINGFILVYNGFFFFLIFVDAVKFVQAMAMKIGLLTL